MGPRLTEDKLGSEPSYFFPYRLMGRRGEGGEGLKTTFNDVWNDLKGVLKGRDYVRTLAQGIRNDLLEARPDEIVVRSEKTGETRHIPEKRFRFFVIHLLNNGNLSLQEVPDEENAGVGSVIIALLAQLPYVEHEIRPVALRLTERTPL